MNLPKILLLIMFGISLLTSAHNHGKSKGGVHSFWATLLAAAIEIGLLAWGGFFG